MEQDVTSLVTLRNGQSVVWDLKNVNPLNAPVMRTLEICQDAANET